MTDKLSTILQWFLYALMAVSVILGVLFYVNSGEGDTLIYWGYVLIITGVVASLLASLISLFLNPKGAVKILLILAGMVVLAIISYTLSTNEFSALQLEKLNISENTSRMVGTGLIFTYVLAGLAVLAIIFSAVSRIFK